MIRISITTTGNISLRNKMIVFFFLQENRVLLLPYLKKKKKKRGIKSQVRLHGKENRCYLHHFFLFWMWMAAQVWLRAQVTREEMRSIFWAESQLTQVSTTVCSCPLVRTRCAGASGKGDGVLSSV